MIVQYWSDFSCPFCYIAEARLERILGEMGISDECRLDFRSFRLNPKAKKVPAHPIFDSYAKRFGHDSATAQIQRIDAMAASEGLDFRYGTALNSNTLDAHRLTKYILSEDRKKGDEFVRRLYDAFFRDNLVLANHDVLRKLADGLADPDDVDRVLTGDEFRSEVLADESEARRYGVNAVPFFLINGKYRINGAVDDWEFRGILRKALDEEESDGVSGSSCGPDGCR